MLIRSRFVNLATLKVPSILFIIRSQILAHSPHPQERKHILRLTAPTGIVQPGSQVSGVIGVPAVLNKCLGAAFEGFEEEAATLLAGGQGLQGLQVLLVEGEGVVEVGGGS